MVGIWKHVRLNTIGDLAVFWWRERTPHSHTTHNLILFYINRFVEIKNVYNARVEMM